MKEKEKQGEEKKNWNTRVLVSIAKAFDTYAAEEVRNEKGTAVSAACLLFLLVDDDVRRRAIDLVKLAEGRGYEGTVLRASKKEWQEKGYRLITGDELAEMLRVGTQSIRNLQQGAAREPPPQDIDKV